jgi:gluconate 2-dehydrogenase gamma chain
MNQKLIARRELLKRVGAAAALPSRILLPIVAPSDARIPVPAQSPSAAVASAPETLTAGEAETLGAIAARLIPTDGNGPGAMEAGAARYIDRALGGALSAFRETYRAGLAGIDRYAQSAKGNSFARLSAADQDAVLRDLESNAAAGFGQASAFFSLVLAHTIQGTFCDPYYGGNVNFAGWDLIGYPGVRLAVTAGEQAINARPAPTHMSAYDYRMFSGSRPARAARDVLKGQSPRTSQVIDPPFKTSRPHGVRARDAVSEAEPDARRSVAEASLDQGGGHHGN